MEVARHHASFWEMPSLNKFMLITPHRSRQPKWFSRLVIIATLVSLASACGGGSDDNSDDGAPLITDTGQDSLVAQMRFANLIPDAPTIEMLHEGDNSSLFIETPNFGGSSNRNDFVTGDFFFNFGFTDGLGSRVTLFEQSGFPLVDGNEHSFIMVGALANAQLMRVDNPEFLVGLDDLTADVDPQVQFAHAAVGVEAVDFFLTENGGDLSTPLATARLAFGETSPLFDVTEGDSLQLRAFPAGDTTTLLFDSGSIPIGRTTRSLVVAANYFGPSEGTATGVQLLLYGQTPVALSNLSQPTTLRVHNVVADEPGIDVYLGDTLGVPEFENVAFRERTAELPLPPQSSDILITEAGNPLNILLTLEASLLTGGTRNSLYVGGLGSDAENGDLPNLGTTLALESTRAISGGSAVRLFNGSSSSSSLSIFLLRPGQTMETTAPSTLNFGGYTGLPVVTGDFDLIIVENANQSTIFGPERVTPQLGESLNIVIRDSLGGSTPIQVDLVSDPTIGL